MKSPSLSVHRALPPVGALVVLAALLLSSCSQRPIPPGFADESWGVEITWHGHSCFSIRDDMDRIVVIDPFDSTVGIPLNRLRADALLITHDHFDHNARSRVTANRHFMEVVDSSGTVSLAGGGIQVSGIPSDHDAVGGRIHGPNLMFLIETAGLRILHMGDFNQAALTAYQRSLIGRVDVVMIPTGGFTTLGPVEARDVVRDLNPRLVFPMHHGKSRFFDLRPVTEFTALFPKEQLEIRTESRRRIRAHELVDSPHPVVVTLVPVPRN